MLIGDRLAVWGDPIAHSLSPRLHAAAYDVLGLDWTYGRERVDDAQFADRFAGLDDRWRGLSLTMPLKHVAARTAEVLDGPARLSGAANTLLHTSAGVYGFNTDVGGLVRAMRENGVHGASRARILGAGATATSALLALADLGATAIEVVARRPEAVEPLIALGAARGITVTGTGFDAAPASVPLTLATLPGGTDLGADADRWAEHGGTLVDVGYGAWPTPLGARWQVHGSPAFSGHGMLLHQALLQVRVFVSGDPDAPLDAEEAVLAAMRSALVGD